MGARRERGWTLLIVLIVLAIVAFLARDALMQYFGSITAAARPQERQATPATDATQAVPSLPAPVERARGAEATVLERAQEGARRIDERAR